MVKIIKTIYKRYNALKLKVMKRNHSSIKSNIKFNQIIL